VAGVIIKTDGKKIPREDKDMTEEMYRLIQETFELTDEQLECVKEVYEG